MQSSRQLLYALSFVAGVGLVEPVAAAPTSYNSLGTFQAEAGSLATDTFNDLHAGIELSSPLLRTVGGATYQAAAGPASDLLTASDGAADVWLSTNLGTDSITLTAFSTGIRAVGAHVFATDLAGFPTTVASVTVTATDASGTLAFSVLWPSTDSFVGFTSVTSIQSVNFSVDGTPGAWITLDDVVLGPVTAVPEPAAYLLLLAGLGGLAGALRRRI